MDSIRNENHDLSCIEHDYISIHECNPVHLFDQQFPLQSRMIRDEDLPTRVMYQGNASDLLKGHKTLKASVCIVFMICVVGCLVTMAVLLAQKNHFHSRSYEGKKTVFWIRNNFQMTFAIV